MLNKVKAFFFTLVLVLGLGSQMANATILSGSPSITVGGRVFTDLTNLIVLHSFANGTNPYTTFRKMGATSGYQVTLGKTLHIYAAKCLSSGSSANSFSIGYGASDVGMSSASAPTSPVYGYTGSTTTQVFTAVGNGSAAFTELAMDLPVPSQDYVMHYGVSVQCTVYGYEQ